LFSSVSVGFIVNIFWLFFKILNGWDAFILVLNLAIFSSFHDFSTQISKISEGFFLFCNLDLTRTAMLGAAVQQLAGLWINSSKRWRQTVLRFFFLL
jgi:hypothetical protein